MHSVVTLAAVSHNIIEKVLHKVQVSNPMQSVTYLYSFCEVQSYLMHALQNFSQSCRNPVLPIYYVYVPSTTASLKHHHKLINTGKFYSNIL